MSVLVQCSAACSVSIKEESQDWPQAEDNVSSTTASKMSILQPMIDSLPNQCIQSVCVTGSDVTPSADHSKVHYVCYREAMENLHFAAEQVNRNGDSTVPCESPVEPITKSEKHRIFLDFKLLRCLNYPHSLHSLLPNQLTVRYNIEAILVQ